MIEMTLGAIFNFPLPDWTPMVVVHPDSTDVISVGQDCSYNVSPAFQSRCVQPWCDSKRHRLSFTLTNVTEEDEGDYVCLEEGPQRRPIYNCSRSLHVKKCVQNTSEGGRDSAPEVALVTCLGLTVLVALLIGVIFRKKCRNLLQVLRRLFTRVRGHQVAQMNLLSDGGDDGNGLGRGPLKKVLIFEGLYDKGKVYIFPLLVPPVKKPLSVSTLHSEDELQPLLRNPDQRLTAKEKEFEIKSLLRLKLQNFLSTRPEDLPSFILHKTHISKQENAILVLDKNLGVVVMIVNTATSLEDLSSAEEAARHLVEARDTVRHKLRGLVTSGAIRAVLSLPCLTQNEAGELKGSLQFLQSNPDVELLAGQDPQVFKEWMERQWTGSDIVVWESSSQKGHSPDSVYKMVVSSFLTLPLFCEPGESPDSPDPTKSLLLTPAQVEVRDSTARLLHVRGPPGSGKTMLLVHRARQWLAEGKALILAVGGQFCDIQLAEIERAVRKRQREEICSRIRVCCTVHEVQTAAKVLKDTYIDVEICLIVDILSEVSLLRLLLPDVRSGNLSHVWTAGWDMLYSAPSDLSKQMHDLGWESLHLPDCIRCTDNTVELLNMLGKEAFPPIPSCSVPRNQDIPPWTAVDHCQHPDHTNTLTRCVCCKEEMAAAVPSTKQGLRLNNWVVLRTGASNLFVNSEAVEQAAKHFGVPISYDNSFLRHEAALSSSSSPQNTAGVPNIADFHTRVLDGVDEKGRPTLHALRVEDFRGMEREGVILVHWDYRDTDPGHQSPRERASRLEEDRRQWIQAASRSTGQVILLLLSPSPARSLLGLPEAVMP